MTKADEKVLCVMREWADEIVCCEIGPSHKLDSLLNQKVYRNRKTPNDDGPCAEEDDRWKQLIPYIVVVNKNGQILAYNRGSKGGEKRLASKWAIGFGGHVNNQDADWMAGINREIREEIDVNHPIAFDKRYFDKVHWAKLHGPIGFLNDDSNPVGRVHLGVVYILRADEVVPKENPEFEWVSIDDMEVNVNVSVGTIENWAVLALPMVRAWIDGGGA